MICLRFEARPLDFLPTADEAPHFATVRSVMTARLVIAGDGIGHKNAPGFHSPVRSAAAMPRSLISRNGIGRCVSWEASAQEYGPCWQPSGGNIPPSPLPMNRSLLSLSHLGDGYDIARSAARAARELASALSEIGYCLNIGRSGYYPSH